MKYINRSEEVLQWIHFFVYKVSRSILGLHGCYIEKWSHRETVPSCLSHQSCTPPSLSVPWSKAWLHFLKNI